MRLLTEELRAQLPPLSAQKDNPDPMIYVRFILPIYDWSWYIIEGERKGNDFVFYGYVSGVECEWEHFSLKDLKVLSETSKNDVIRDQSFKSMRWSEAKARFKI